MPSFDELLNGVYSPSVSDVAVLVREVQVHIGLLAKAVTIRIFYDTKLDVDPYRFELSARMKCARDGSVIEAGRTASSENEALRRAIRMLTQHYDDAVREGHMPDESWLVDGDRAGSR